MALTSAMVWLIWISRISFTARISATWTFAALAALAAKVGWRRWKRKVMARGRVENMMDGLVVCWRPILYKCVLDLMSRVQYYW